MNQKILKNSSVTIFKYILQRIQKIKNILIEQGYPNRIIQQRCVNLIADNYVQSETFLDAIKRALRVTSNTEHNLQQILQKIDVECTKLQQQLKQKQQIVSQHKQKKQKIKKKFKQIKHQKPLIPKQTINQFNQNKFSSIFKSPNNYQSSISQNIIKAELLKQFINQKMRLVQLCQKKLQCMDQFQNITFETF